MGMQRRQVAQSGSDPKERQHGVLPAPAWTAAISMMTVVFALGQIAGPIVGGVLADGSGGVRAALGLAVGLLAGAMLIATAQRERPASRTRGRTTLTCAP